MRDLFLCSACALFSIISSAQITIDHDNMPSADQQFTYKLTASLPDGTLPSLTGEGITWDYSNLNQGLSLVDSFITVSSAPFAYQIFFNNPFFYPSYVADYARRDSDINIGPVALTNTFVFFKNNAQGLRNVGYGAEVNGIPTPVQNDPIDYIYEFPLTFGDEFNGSSESEVSIPTLGYFHRSQVRQTIVEGYGTLIMPDNSYEVLKVKVILNTTDSIYVDQFGTGFNIENPEEVIYQWLAVEHIEPVLEISQQLGFGYTIRYFSELVDDLDEPLVTQFTIAPNPASESLKINTQQRSLYSYRVLDLDGRVLKSGILKPHEDAHLISLTDMSSGIYLLELVDAYSGLRSSQVWLKD